MVGKLRNNKTLSRIYTGWKDEVDQRKQWKGIPELPYGIKALDNLCWGLHRKQVCCIAARPSEGKTTLGLNIGWNLSDAGKTVYFISLEMSKEQLLERIFCDVFSVHNTKIRTGQIDTETERKMESFERLVNEQKPSLLIRDDLGYNYQEIEYAVKNLKPKADVIILDYIQLCSLGNYRNKQEAISEYIRAMKQLATEENIAVIVLSQINRKVGERTDRRPQLHELKGCVHGDSIVEGRKIKDIVEKKQYFPVESIGTKVTPSRLIDVGPKECLKIKTKSGKEIILSTDTKLYNGEWIKSKHLKVGDRIYVKKEE